MRRTVITVLCSTGVFAGCAAKRPPVSSLRSTLAGVYTPEQATRGAEVYLANCRTCHSGQEHSATFKARWNGRPLSDLTRFVSRKMPGNFPGTLTPGQYTVVIAYMLQMIGVPSGAEDLPSDEAVLRTIRFDTPATGQR